MLTVITNARLLDCIGDEPLEDTSVVIENGVIKDIYSGERPLPADALVINVGGKTVLPGLTDAHIHPAFTENPWLTRRGDPPPLYTALSMAAFLEQVLQSGFTTLRCAAFTHWSLKQAVEDNLIKGPRLLIACAPLHTTGGHFDRNVHGETLLHKDRERLCKSPRLCDGVDECIKAAREQFRNGANHIKIGLGGIDDASGETWHLQFTEAEIRAIVEEAEARGSYVMAHCEHDRTARRSTECGVRTIEHGLFLSEETIRLMKERGTFLVPTILPYQFFIDRTKEAGASEKLLKKVLQPLGPEHGSVLDGQMRSVEMAHRLGLAMGSGCDLGPWLMPTYNPGMEFKLKTECGMTPYEAIKSATMVNARIFQMEDKIGSIEVRKWADIIAVDGHPDEDVEIFSESANVKLVMKKGEVFKNIL